MGNFSIVNGTPSIERDRAVLINMISLIDEIDL